MFNYLLYGLFIDLVIPPQLFCNRRRVRLFDMDAEDDGEDESLSERSLLDASNGGIEDTRQDESDSNKENIELPR